MYNGYIKFALFCSNCLPMMMSSVLKQVGAIAVVAAFFAVAVASAAAAAAAAAAVVVAAIWTDLGGRLGP